MMKNYQNHAMTDAEARQALADACKQVETNLPLYTYQCQNHSSVNDIYPGCANNQWTCGFWPGEIWLAYEATGDEKFKTAALIQVDSFADRIARKVEVDHHDMGFLYSPTCVAAWKLVGSEKGKNAAIAAADQLLTRYQPSGRFLQAWGTMDDPDNYRYIIDCMLNVPLLYWAAQVTGSDHYREIAAAHTATTLANSFRPDGSTYHTFFMNPDGTPKGGRTCQGYKDDSFWARGQAWGVYGSAIGYTYTHDEKFLDVFRKALGNDKLTVKVEKLKNPNVSSMMTLSEENRRMQEMMKMYGMAGMDPSMFGNDVTLVLNANNKLVQYVAEHKDDEHVPMICEQLYDLAMIAHKTLNPDEMTKFIARSNEILELLAEK